MKQKSSTGSATSSPVRNVTEAEMAILLKKQQQQQAQQSQQQQQTKVNTTIVPNATTIQTQFVTSPTTSAQGKSAVGIQIPTVRTDLIVIFLKKINREV